MSIADPKDLLGTVASWLLTPVRRYTFAAVVVVLATAIRVGLSPYLGSSHSFIAYYPAILFIALVAGFGPSVFATGLSGILAGYFLLRPFLSPGASYLKNGMGLLLFWAASFTIIGLIE